MKPLEIAARFAAFSWYLEVRQAGDETKSNEAKLFSEENWRAFLHVANEDLGRFLMRIATPSAKSSSGKRKSLYQRELPAAI